MAAKKSVWIDEKTAEYRRARGSSDDDVTGHGADDQAADDADAEAQE